MVLGASLAGCASSDQILESSKVLPPSNQEVCCNNFSQFPFSPLDYNDDISLDIDEASPVGKFETGNSHFAAFKFSERSADVYVTVSALMIDDVAFAPEVILLDKNFRVKETLKFDGFQILPSSAFTRTNYIEKFKANAEETPYFVVYTPAEELGKTITVDHPAKVRAKEFGEVMPMVTDLEYVHSLGGRIKIEVDTVKLRAFRANQPAQQPVVTATEQPKKVITSVQPETKNFYISAIESAVAAGDIPKALSLLDEAKAINVEGAQEAFVKAVNKK